MYGTTEILKIWLVKLKNGVIRSKKSADQHINKLEINISQTVGNKENNVN